MKCEANGCPEELPEVNIRTPKGEATDQHVTPVLAGWCVAVARNDGTEGKQAGQRLVVMCPRHAMGIAPSREFLTAVSEAMGTIATTAQAVKAQADRLLGGAS